MRVCHRGVSVESGSPVRSFQTAPAEVGLTPRGPQAWQPSHSLEVVVKVWGAAQHFAEASGLDAGTSAKWAGFELHRGFSIARSVCFLP